MLAGVHGIGPVAFAALLARYGDALAILREASSPGGVARLATPDRDARPDDADRVVTPEVAEAIADAARRAGTTLARIRELGLKVLTVEDPAYPMRLASIEMPPHVLYVLGDPAALSTDAAVAIVGTRRATDAGRAFAARLATNLVAVGASVVSGLAVGIDGAAHAAAVHAHGRRSRSSAPAMPSSIRGHTAGWRRRSSGAAARSSRSWARTSPRARGRSRAGTGSSAASPTRRSWSRRRRGAAH